MTKNKQDTLDNPMRRDNDGCRACKDLLAHMERFFDILQNARKSSEADWLTVDQVANELKISKSIVYRLIHNGLLPATNIAADNGKLPRKGHYRIKRSDLNKYLESKQVNPLPDKSNSASRPLRHIKVKNHLGL